MVRHGQNQRAVLLKGVNERILKRSQNPLPYPWPNFLRRFRELGNKIFGPFYFCPQASSQPLGLNLKVADRIQQFPLDFLVVPDRYH